MQTNVTFQTVAAAFETVPADVSDLIAMITKDYAAGRYDKAEAIAILRAVGLPECDIAQVLS
jgi:hypothetical protein